MSKEERDELYRLIYPFIFIPSRVRCFLKRSYVRRLTFHTGHVFQNSQSPFYADQSCPVRFNGYSYPDSASHELPTYLGRHLIRFPDTSFAAINLAFVIYEMRQFTIPYHIPENRAIANATQRTGPTKDDYHAMNDYKTPLFADCLSSTDEPGFDFSFDPRRSMNHDLEFGSLIQTSTCLDTFVYTLGTLTGVWEGIYRVSIKLDDFILQF